MKVNGQTVAKLYNSGGAETSNSVGAKLMDLPSMQSSDSGMGPELAQRRAEQIAKALGGTVVRAKTAQTQPQWRSRPPMQFTYDYVAMEKFMQARAASMRTLVDAQSIAQSR